MSLYPTLEDMKVDKILLQEQEQFIRQHNMQEENLNNDRLSFSYNNQPTAPSTLYPTMDSYMGLDLTSSEIALIERQQAQLAALQSAQTNTNRIATFADKSIVAPLSGDSVGLKRAQITNGIREVILCKDKDNKIGMRCKAINQGIFVILVTQGSPASLAGLRFGDQLLQINEQYVAGMSHQSLHSLIKKLPGDRITFVVRDRPLERTVTLYKDNGGEAGFSFNNGKITSIVKDSSAARNGLLTDYQILEVNGQNVVGLADKKIKEFIQNSDNTLTLTLMPTIIYEKLMDNTHISLIKKLMDHSLFDY